MIDFEKLKLAHELCFASKRYYFSLTLGLHKGFDFASLYDSEANRSMLIGNFECVEELLSKIQELTKSKPKYESGQIVWFDMAGVPASFNITEIEPSEDYNYFYDDTPECDLYPSQLALIEAQIAHWTKLLEEEIKPKFEGEIKGCDQSRYTLCQSTSKQCQHESDGKRYIFNAAQNRCTKCGEFYK